MTSIGILQILVFFGLILLVTKPVGLFMSRLFQGERTFLHPVLRPIEVLVYKLCGVREDQEQRWTQYTASLLAFSLFAFLFPYALMRLQGLLPLNPQGFGASQVSPDQSFNTAMSFMTNTNWQWYSGEAAMSYLVQMAALAVQNFVSAAAGLAVAIALIRGFARHETDKIGNFWVDLTRGTLYVLIPISIVAALVLCSQGAIQNFQPYTVAKTVEGATQTIAQGPVASQVAIKQLGTNGGGFFNANSSHSFESPNGFTNLVHIFLIFILGAGLTYTFGHMVKDTRQGLGAVLGHGGDVPDGRVRRVSGGTGGQSDPGEAGRGKRRDRHAVGREHGGQGDAVRDRRVGAVCHGDHRRQLRRGQQHARQLHAARRSGAAVQHADRRSDLRRRRRGSLRHAALRHRRRVHRRPDGRPDAGVHRQEDPAEGSQDGALRHPGDRLLHPRGLRHQHRHSVRQGQLLEPRRPGDRESEQRRPARLERDPVRVHEPDGEQRQRVRRHHGQHAVVRPDARPVHAVRAVPLHHPVAGDCGQPRRQEGRPDVGRHVAHARPALCRPARGDRDRRRAR